MKLSLPHPLVLLTGAIAVAAALTYVVPAGEFERRDDPVTGRSVVVAGTYHSVPAVPVSAFGALVAIPKGLAKAASVVFLVLLVGGAFEVVDRTGALRRAVGALARRLATRREMVIPLVAILFATGGALANMQEEIIAMLPALLLLSARFGWDPVTAVAMSVGSAIVGSAFSPINPFQVGIAQQLAGLPLLSGAGFRLVLLAVALLIWIAATIRLARRSAVASDAAAPATVPSPQDDAPLSTRDVVLLLAVLVAYVVFITGILRYGWGFDEMSAVFFAMGVFAGLVAGLRLTGTAEAFVAGFRSMAYAAVLIGFAAAISVVLEEGKIIDSIVNGLASPLSGLPLMASALGMVGLHSGIHVVVPSVSGQAVLTMPVLVPVSDLLGLSRQVTVLAYQVGAGLCEMLTPTNGALMAIIAAAGTRYDRWLRFALPVWGILMAVGALAVVIAIAVGLA